MHIALKTSNSLIKLKIKYENLELSRECTKVYANTFSHRLNNCFNNQVTSFGRKIKQKLK